MKLMEYVPLKIELILLLILNHEVMEINPRNEINFNCLGSLLLTNNVNEKLLMKIKIVTKEFMQHIESMIKLAK